MSNSKFWVNLLYRVSLSKFDMILLSIEVNAMIHEMEIRLPIRNNEMQQENEDILLRGADANLIKYAINVRSLVVLGIQVDTKFILSRRNTLK